jgi:hypothetical protein
VTLGETVLKISLADMAVRLAILPGAGQPNPAQGKRLLVLTGACLRPLFGLSAKALLGRSSFDLAVDLGPE